MRLGRSCLTSLLVVLITITLSGGVSCEMKEGKKIRWRRADIAIHELAVSTGALPKCIGETFWEPRNGCSGDDDVAWGSFTCEAGGKLYSCGPDADIPCVEIQTAGSGK